jgi:hypothetical protein
VPLPWIAEKLNGQKDKIRDYTVDVVRKRHKDLKKSGAKSGKKGTAVLNKRVL